MLGIIMISSKFAYLTLTITGFSSLPRMSLLLQSLGNSSLSFRILLRWFLLHLCTYMCCINHTELAFHVYVSPIQL